MRDMTMTKTALVIINLDKSPAGKTQTLLNVNVILAKIYKRKLTYFFLLKDKKTTVFCLRAKTQENNSACG